MKDDMKKSVDYISDMVNTMAFDYESFCALMQREHRTLQDNFTHLCVEWLLTCGSTNYKYDERNFYSYDIGKKFNELINPSKKLSSCSPWEELINTDTKEIYGYSAIRMIDGGPCYIYYTILGDPIKGYIAQASNTVDCAERVAVNNSFDKKACVYKNLNSLKAAIEDGSQLWLYVGRCNTGNYTKTVEA